VTFTKGHSIAGQAGLQLRYLAKLVSGQSFEEDYTTVIMSLNSSGQGGGSEDAGDGETEEESSSHPLIGPPIVPAEGDNATKNNDHLEEFRQQWRQELVSSERQRDGSPAVARHSARESEGPSVSKAKDDEATAAVASVEDQALKIFLQGVEDEEEGKLYEAIVKYKKAIHLMPDVERKAFDITSKRAKSRQQQQQEQAVDRETTNKGHSSGVTNESEEIDLVQSFNSMTLQTRGSTALCQPEDPEAIKNCHISALPMEVLIHIFKWVVSSDLDVKSLESVSGVCRGFYLASRSSDLWRPICLRTWGVHVIPLSLKKQLKEKNDWRTLFLKRPRVHLSGCYISKMTYMREGERSFTDHEFCRAWHVVTYYRLIRFLPGGVVLMKTTPDLPVEAVKAMYPNMMNHGYVGQYKTIDNRVIGVVKKIDPPPTQETAQEKTYKRHKKSKVKPYVFEVPDQVLHFELVIQGKRFKTLQWANYAITSKYKSSGREQTSQFDIKNENNFPALHFSTVRSYASTFSNAPLEG